MPGGIGKRHYKVRFGAMNAKVKVFRSMKRNDLDPVDAANELLEKIRIDGLRGIDEHLQKQVILRVVHINLQHSKYVSANLHHIHLTFIIYSSA